MLLLLDNVKKEIKKAGKADEEDQVEAAMYMVSEKCLGEVIQLIEQRAGANEKGNIKA
jgi:archaellum component FlaC